MFADERLCPYCGNPAGLELTYPCQPMFACSDYQCRACGGRFGEAEPICGPPAPEPSAEPASPNPEIHSESEATRPVKQARKRGRRA